MKITTLSILLTNDLMSPGQDLHLFELDVFLSVSCQTVPWEMDLEALRLLLGSFIFLKA